MKLNVFLEVGKKLLDIFYESCEAKRFVVYLLEKYAKSTDNDIDDMVVNLVREKLLVNCPDEK